MMDFSYLGWSSIVLGLLAACGGESDAPSTPGGGGTSGMPGNGGRPNNGGSSGAAERGDGVAPDPATLVELRALQACDVPEPCNSSSVQLIEAYTHNIQKEVVSCVLGALAERRPGRYVHTTEAIFSNGQTRAEHVFVVAADGSVAYVRDPSQNSSTPGQPENVIPPDPAQRCTLKHASYFEACLADVQAATSSDDDAAWACTFGDGTSLVPSRLDWFERCEAESPPRCESAANPSDQVDAGTAGDASADASP